MSMFRFHPRPSSRRGFTLVELLVVCTILAILMSLVLMALAGATEQARNDRTRAEITKLHSLVMNRWEGYRQRPLPVRIPAGTQPGSAAGIRLQALWYLMRAELPDRKSDVLASVPAGLSQPPYNMRAPSLQLAYQRRVAALTGTTVAAGLPGWSTDNQQAECLYLIIATMRDGDASGLDSFTSREIGDTDGDGVPEILDGWGRPIRFLRWAPGFTSEMQTRDVVNQYDPFDPLKILSQLHSPDGVHPEGFALTPLIFSAGPDGEFDMFLDTATALDYSATTPPNFPWAVFDNKQLGASLDANGDGNFDDVDNITNHFNVAR
jgi:prepilin-type N-terminal cleavage/methylation domain-containing protein